MVNRLLQFFCSLRLTVVLLTLSMFLIFFGTMAEVDLNLYQVQVKYFRSLFVCWSPRGTEWKIPVYPGGYLLGGMLLVNLLAAHTKRFKLSWNKCGLFLIHAGIILLLLGQLATDILQIESQMHLTEGQTLNYSESPAWDELAVINTSKPDYDEVLAVPCSLLQKQEVFTDARLPFSITVKKFFPNSARVATPSPTAPVLATQGLGTSVTVEPLPMVTDTDHRNVPSAVIELKSGETNLGTWLVSDWYKSQDVRAGDKSFKIIMRPTRYYTPFSLKLLKFRFDKYLGTDIPKNFSSQVRILNPETKEDRETRIYMNNPLRYAGATYYQSGTDPNDPKATILQVVKNPGWLTPYVACILVGAGMLWQFLQHLVRFIRKTKLSPQPATAAAPRAQARRRNP